MLFAWYSKAQHSMASFKDKAVMMLMNSQFSGVLRWNGALVLQFGLGWLYDAVRGGV